MEIYISVSRNVRNTDEFDSFLEKLGAPAEILIWLKSVFRKWLFENGPATKITEVSAESPQWAKDAAAKGELFQIDYSASENLARPVIDYLKFLLAAGKKFDRMSYPDADKQQKEWHEALAKKAGGSAILKEDGLSVFKMFDTGYAWVKVFGEDSLNREGDIMGHCVGSYYDEVSRGDTYIYSLRDAKNIPHITVEYAVKDRAIKQIKGTANKAVIPKYHPYMLEFLKNFPCDSIYLDESGLTQKQVKENITMTPARVDKLSYKGVNFTYNASALPSFNKAPEQFVKEAKTKSVLADNSLGDAMGKDPKVVAALLEYCQLNEICGFSLYKKPVYFGSSGLDIRAYEDFVLSLTTFSKVVGNSKFLFAKKPGALWPIISDSATDTVLMCDKLNMPLISVKEQDGKLSITKVVKTNPKIIADFKSWLAGKRVGIAIMSNSKKIRDLEAALNEGSNEEPKSRIKEINHLNVSTLPLLVSAISVFNSNLGTSKKIAKECDSLKSIAQVKEVFKKHKLGTSGYLYDYFDTFFVCALMKNKKLAAQVLLGIPGMARQFDAFTVAPAGIVSGSFARRRSASELAIAYKEVNKHLAAMLPFQKDVEPANEMIGVKYNRILKKFYGMPPK